MRITRRALACASTSFVALAAAGAVCLTGPVAGATPARPVASGLVAQTLTGTAATRAAIANYWTPQRMRHAISADKLVSARSAPTGRTSGSGSGPATTLARSAPTGRTGAAPATGPVTTLARPQAALTNRPQASTSTSTSTTLTPSNLQAQGKLFFHDPWTGYDEACSAGTVGNPAKDMVFTAGHCLWAWSADGTTSLGWMTQVMFAPGYNNGVAPYGKWPWNHMRTFPEYSDNGDPNYDIGVVNVSPNPSDGSLLVDRVGGNGLSYNAGYSVTVDVFGYPQSYTLVPYNGQNQYGCYNVPTYQIGSSIETGCDTTHGGSGGSWLIFYNASTGLGNIDGVTSTDDPNQPGYIVSPYFDDKIPTIYGQTEYL